jgi:hypothetical protein
LIQSGDRSQFRFDVETAVIDHYLDDARTEQRLFDETVSCAERPRFLG